MTTPTALGHPIIKNLTRRFEYQHGLSNNTSPVDLNLDLVAPVYSFS
jgi:hypothetical protein